MAVNECCQREETGLCETELANFLRGGAREHSSSRREVLCFTRSVDDKRGYRRFFSAFNLCKR